VWGKARSKTTIITSILFLTIKVDILCN